MKKLLTRLDLYLGSCIARFNAISDPHLASDIARFHARIAHWSSRKRWVVGATVAFAAFWLLDPYIIPLDDPYRSMTDSIVFYDADTKKPIPDVIVVSYWRGEQGHWLQSLRRLNVIAYQSPYHQVTLTAPKLSQSDANGVAYIDSVRTHAFRGTRYLDARWRHTVYYAAGYQYTGMSTMDYMTDRQTYSLKRMANPSIELTGNEYELYARISPDQRCSTPLLRKFYHDRIAPLGSRAPLFPKKMEDIYSGDSYPSQMRAPPTQCPAP